MNKKSKALYVMKELNSTENLYIPILQENITRMNQNSMQCKTWCVALVAGLFAVVATTGKAELLFLGMAITLGAYILDVSYLREEKNFRCLEKRLVDELKKGDNANGELIGQYLFDFNKKKLMTKRTRFITRVDYKGAPDIKANCQHWRDALFSWSTLPVYIVILTVIVSMYIVLHEPAIVCCCSCQ